VNRHAENHIELTERCYEISQRVENEEIERKNTKLRIDGFA